MSTAAETRRCLLHCDFFCLVISKLSQNVPAGWGFLCSDWVGRNDTEGVDSRARRISQLAAAHSHLPCVPANRFLPSQSAYTSKPRAVCLLSREAYIRRHTENQVGETASACMGLMRSLDSELFVFLCVHIYSVVIARQRAEEHGFQFWNDEAGSWGKGLCA